MMGEEFMEEIIEENELPEGVLGIEELDDEELETSGGTSYYTTQRNKITFNVTRVKGFQWISNPIGATITCNSDFFSVKRGSKFGRVSFKATIYHLNGYIDTCTWIVNFIKPNYVAKG